MIQVFVSPGAIRFVSIPEREGPAVLLRLAEEDGVVPRVAGGGPAVAVGALADDIREDRAHVPGEPARAERQVERVHAEVAHDSRTRRSRSRVASS